MRIHVMLRDQQLHEFQCDSHTGPILGGQDNEAKETY